MRSIVSSGLNKKDEEEVIMDKTLRPKRLDEIVGRENIKKKLKILIQAAKERNEAVEHIIFYGPHGLGKTMFAHVIANEIGKKIYVTSGPAITNKAEIASILTNLEKFDVLFIDEIHRLRKEIEEFLYPAMEEYKLDLTIGKGPSAKVIRLDLAPFTLIGATTRIGLLSGPLRDRFGVIQRLDFYSQEELKEIVLRASKKIEVKITESGAAEVAKRSRGTARIALRLLRRVRDYSQVNGREVIDLNTVKEALTLNDIDEEGLDPLDRKLLTILVKNFKGGPVGIETLSAAVAEDVETICDVYEPYLLQSGFIKRIPRGRVATEKAFKYIGVI